MTNTPVTKDQEHLRVIIDSNPKVPDRTRAILEGGENPVPEMLKSGQTLMRAGVDFIIIPCISAHYFLDEIQDGLMVPILSAFDMTLRYIKSNHPDITRVGMLATSGTIQGGRFAEKLSEGGLETLTPEESVHNSVMDAIYTIKADASGRRRNETRQVMIRATEHLIDQGAGGIIAGCTEIPLVLSQGDIPVPLFNPVEILARAAIKEAKSG